MATKENKNTHSLIFDAIETDKSFSNLIEDERIAIFNYLVDEPVSMVDLDNATYALGLEYYKDLKSIVFDALLRLDINA